MMSRFLRPFWVAGTVALLICAAIEWRTFLSTPEVARPSSPVDLVQPVYANYWRFLANARPLVPDGSSYTIRAADLSVEHDLFMLSLGLYSGVKAYPHSYFRAEQSGSGREATHVLVYGSCDCPPEATLMRPVKGGCVCSRM